MLSLFLRIFLMNLTVGQTGLPGLVAMLVVNEEDVSERERDHSECLLVSSRSVAALLS